MLINEDKIKIPRETAVQPKKYEQAVEYLMDYKATTELEKKAENLLGKLQEAGFVSFFVGGFVRDLILGEEIKDIDIATSALPEQIIALAQDNNYGFNETNKKFGMVRVVIDGTAFEVTTFRNDGDYSDQRRPDKVDFVSKLEEDAARRDFTFNALYFDPREKRVIDFFGGLSDLKQNILRFVGQPERILSEQYKVAAERIKEDPLRIVRAVRFAARFGLEIDPEAFQAIIDNRDLLASKDKQGVSWERKGQELNSMWLDKQRAEAFRLLDKLGLLKYLLPEINNLKDVNQGEMYHQEGDVFTHLLLGMQKVQDVLIDKDFQNYFNKNFVLQLTWAWLLHDIAKPETQKENNGKITFYGHDKLGADRANKILRRFGFSQKDIVKPVTWLIAKHMNIRNLGETKSKSKLLEYFTNPNFLTLLALLKVDSLSSKPIDLTDYKKALDKYKNSLNEGILERVKVDKDIINGREILSFGFVSGPIIGVIKNLIKKAFIDKKIKDKEEALTWLEKNKELLKEILEKRNLKEYKEVKEELYNRFF